MQLGSSNLTYKCSTMSPGNPFIFDILGWEVKVTLSVLVFSDAAQCCHCCCIRKPCCVFPAAMSPQTNNASEKVSPTSPPHVCMLLDAGFSTSWVFALLWVLASFSWFIDDDFSGLGSRKSIWPTKTRAVYSQRFLRRKNWKIHLTDDCFDEIKRWGQDHHWWVGWLVGV